MHLADWDGQKLGLKTDKSWKHSCYMWCFNFGCCAHTLIHTHKRVCTHTHTHTNKHTHTHTHTHISKVLTRMVYLDYISCLRYTILVGNPRYIWKMHIPTLSLLFFSLICLSWHNFYQLTGRYTPITNCLSVSQSVCLSLCLCLSLAGRLAVSVSLSLSLFLSFYLSSYTLSLTHA